jgi:hypothetical protein
MGSFDTLFPDPMDCYFTLFQDAVYEHDKTMRYIFLICLALHPQGVDLTIHNNKAQFEEFLNQLHFRNLSRSSLEFFLPYNKH